VGAFALRAEQAEELDRPAVHRPEPVRRAGVELGRFARREHEVVFAEDEPQPPMRRRLRTSNADLVAEETRAAGPTPANVWCRADRSAAASGPRQALP